MSAGCDAMRDALPDALAGTLPAAAARAVLEHAASCPDCRDEAAILRALRTPLPVPAGLEQRVLQATSVRRSYRAAPGHWARNVLLAATLGAALLGGASLLRRQGSPVRLPATTAVATSAVRQLDGRSLLQRLPGADADAGLDAAPVTLDDLSTDELQALLKEMQS